MFRAQEDEVSSTAKVSAELLLWLDEQNATEEVPYPLHLFLEREGNEVTDGELTRASRRLGSLRLIDGINSDDSPRFLLAGLTAAGQQCAEDFGGDTEKWETRHVSKDQSVHVQSGGDAQVAAHAHDVTQIKAGGDVNVSELAEAARLASDSLPSLALPHEVEADVKEAIEGILAEEKKDVPDQSKLKSWGARLKAAVPLAAGGGTIVKLILDGLNGAGIV